MGSWDDHTITLSTVDRRVIGAIDAKKETDAKRKLRRRLRMYLRKIWCEHDVTEIAFYDGILDQLASTHDVVEELNALLELQYVAIFYRDAFALEESADFARMQLYEGHELESGLPGFAAMVQDAIDADDLDFTSTGENADCSVVWVA